MGRTRSLKKECPPPNVALIQEIRLVREAAEDQSARNAATRWRSDLKLSLLVVVPFGIVPAGMFLGSAFSTRLLNDRVIFGGGDSIGGRAHTDGRPEEAKRSVVILFFAS